jgi:hypothetical protein
MTQIVHWGRPNKFLSKTYTAKTLTLGLAGMMIEVEMLNLMDSGAYKHNVKQTGNRLFENLLTSNLYIAGRLTGGRGIASGSAEVRRRIMEANPEYTYPQLVSVLCRSFSDYYRSIPEHCNIFYAKTYGGVLAMIKALKQYDKEEDVSELTAHLFRVEEEFNGKLAHCFGYDGYPKPIEEIYGK